MKLSYLFLVVRKIEREVIRTRADRMASGVRIDGDFYMFVMVDG